MRLRIFTIRITALAVLLSSFSDYWAYDRFDPAAPMNSSGVDAVAAFNLRADAPACVGLHSANLPDDHCIYCSPLVRQPGPVVAQPALGAVAANELACAVASTKLKPPAISTSPPSHDSTGFNRPLRV
jgi:hypothetical protein